MPCDHVHIQIVFNWRGGKGWIQKKREPSEFRQNFQLKIEKSDLYLKMTALSLVKLLLLVAGFLFADSDKVSEFRQSDSEFRQSVRQSFYVIVPK